MYGAGVSVFAVWGYVIANAAQGQVELNPRMVAATLGDTVESVESAIAYLCAPDAASRSKEHEGRRLIRVGAFAYEVANHAKYRAIRDEQARREYNAEAQRRHRDKIAKAAAAAASAAAPESTPSTLVNTVNTSSDVTPRVNALEALSANTEAEAEAEAKKGLLTASDESANVDNSSSRVDNSPPVLSDAGAAAVRAIARRWTYAANNGLHDNLALHGQARPITVGRGDSLDAVEHALAAGVRDDALANAIVYRIAATYEPRRPGDTISTLGYLRDRLVDVYHREVSSTFRDGVPAVVDPAAIDVTPAKRTDGARRTSYADDARAERIRTSAEGALAAADSLGMPE